MNSNYSGNGMNSRNEDAMMPADGNFSGMMAPSIDQASASEISELSKRGYAKMKDNNIAGAVEDFRAILKIEENNNYALVGLGDSERKRGHFKDAIDYYTRCLSFHPGNNYALFGLADCYKALNQYHKAIGICE